MRGRFQGWLISAGGSSRSHLGFGSLFQTRCIFRTPYECSQDQWDLYKLDPAYECVVHTFPKISTISKVDSKAPESPNVSGKRNLLTPSPERNPSSSNMKRKAPKVVPPLSESDSEMEVEDIIVDERPARGERLKKVREQIDKNRQMRREKFHAKFQRQEGQDEMIPEHIPLSSPPSSQLATNAVKRKGAVVVLFEISGPYLISALKVLPSHAIRARKSLPNVTRLKTTPMLIRINAQGPSRPTL